MSQVFSRWPSQANPSAGAPGGTPSALPGWMATKTSSKTTRTALAAGASIALVFVPALSCLLVGIVVDQYAWSLSSAGGALLVTVACAAEAARRSAWTTNLERRYDAIFERAGISRWLEDWTAAGEAVAELRRNGIVDMEAYFAARPAELRALKGRVWIRDVNAFTVEETGAPNKQALTMSLAQLLPDTDQTFVQWLVAFARGDRFFRSEAHITRPDGSEIDSLFTAALPTNRDEFSDLIVTSLDITAYKAIHTKLLAAESEMARTSRITTIGAMSASIAHEVNTPLAAIISNAQAALRYLRREKPDIAEVTNALTDVVENATTAREIVERTRAFLSNAPKRLEPVDILEAVRNAILIVERELREYGAVVHVNAMLDNRIVQADAIQLQQVIVNLLVNAAQAMTAVEGPRDIRVDLVEAGADIQIEIVDNGCGIIDTHLTRVFEPFHSSKVNGMDLGLAISKNCIEAHRGRIWASNNERAGATFHFTIPLMGASQ